MLGADPKSQEAAISALKAFPGVAVNPENI